MVVWRAAPRVVNSELSQQIDTPVVVMFSADAADLAEREGLISVY
jgi:hypothetical protein